MSYEVIVNLIANTTTTKRLTIRSAPDDSFYPKGVKVSDTELAATEICRARFHGEWNYRVNLYV
ncbi:MAG: hypothetical protein CSB49_07795 [Proteobacteria bacterium]|nr:MAG: hypothetical protein CSB49_07795 [Pseudomonadota bacterium]